MGNLKSGVLKLTVENMHFNTTSVLITKLTRNILFQIFSSDTELMLKLPSPIFSETYIIYFMQQTY